MFAAIRRASSRVSGPGRSARIVEMHIGELLAFTVAHHEVVVPLFDRPGRREAATVHHVLGHGQVGGEPEHMGGGERAGGWVLPLDAHKG